MAHDRAPPEQRRTWRDALYHELHEAPRTIRELSVAIGAREKDLLDHLVHLERSLQGTGEQLEVHPARCLSCHYTFEDRTRLSKPGRCPTCKSTRIALPRFSIVPD